MSFLRCAKYKDSGVEWLGDVPERRNQSQGEFEHSIYAEILRDVPHGLRKLDL